MSQESVAAVLSEEMLQEAIFKGEIPWLNFLWKEPEDRGSEGDFYRSWTTVWFISSSADSKENNAEVSAELGKGSGVSYVGVFLSWFFLWWVCETCDEVSHYLISKRFGMEKEGDMSMYSGDTSTLVFQWKRGRLSTLTAGCKWYRVRNVERLVWGFILNSLWRSWACEAVR
jgi:hypothetical protein